VYKALNKKKQALLEPALLIHADLVNEVYAYP